MEYVKYDDINYLMEYELKDIYEIFEYFVMDEAKILKILSDNNFKTLIEDKNNIKEYNQIFYEFRKKSDKMFKLCKLDDDIIDTLND